LSAVLSLVALFSNRDRAWASGLTGFAVAMIIQHFLIATTMLVVGLFAVLRSRLRKHHPRSSRM